MLTMLDDQTSPETTSDNSFFDSISKAQSSIEALSPILTSIPPSLSSSENPAFALLHSHEIASQISSLLRQPDSGAGDNNLCRWLYDSFQCPDNGLKLVVLRFLPIIVGVYLSRSVSVRKPPLAGFEAVLLAFYSHETTARGSQSITVNVPDIVSHSSIYHEVKTSNKNATSLNLAVISPSIEPHGTVRSTKRARIVGVALELYYNKISQMPVSSKIDFCEFCVVWAGQDGDMYKNDDRLEDENGSSSETSQFGDNASMDKEGRIPLPWELLQPVLRILGHCLLGPKKDKELYDAACAACRSLYARSLHDIDSKAIMATESLLKLGKMELDPKDDFDPTEIPRTNVITL